MEVYVVKLLKSPGLGDEFKSQSERNKSNMELYFIIVQLLSPVWLFATPWTAARQPFLSITNSQSLLKLMSIESVMPSNHLLLCHPLLLLPSIFPSIKVFSNESALHIRWPLLVLQLQHQTFQWTLRIDFCDSFTLNNSHTQDNGDRQCRESCKRATPEETLYVCVLLTQSCWTLCDPTDCSPPGSPVHGILQARILVWVAMLSSRRSWPRDRIRISYISRIADGFFTAEPQRKPTARIACVC